MVKVQKQLSKKDRKKYHKYVVVLPEDKIRKAGFRKGTELKIESRKGKIILRR
jgi:formylmethanofuran dehydrogenase subunit D